MSDQKPPLVFIPTYNECENVEKLLTGILGLGIELDVLFMDDNSPDGTGRILDGLALKHKQLRVIHRSGKLGIGSAHREGIRFAYTSGYKTLITMDSDFTHPPETILSLLKNINDADVVVGSRYMLSNSLDGWNPYRKALTKIGHFLTGFLLGLKYDATGALRLYRLDKIPHYAFDLVASQGYSFLYESLFILNWNKISIKEIPIKLPARTYGHSKMRFKDAWQSLKLLMILFVRTLVNRSQFEMSEPFIPTKVDPSLQNDQDWEGYWREQKSSSGFIYDIIAVFYRKCIIKPALNYFLKKHFIKGSEVLHAGCGGGQVDEDICAYLKITALDYSVNALNLYKKTNKNKSRLLYGSIFQIPLPDHSIDGVYNLGVMEHYESKDIVKILTEFKRIIKKDGKIVIFWPPEFGLSVTALKIVHYFLQHILKKDAKMHPDEICRVQSKAHVKSIVNEAGFEMVEYYFGPRDLFTQCVVVLKSEI